MSTHDPVREALAELVAVAEISTPHLKFTLQYHSGRWGAALAAARAALSVQPAPSEWRCFHCEEVFTDREAASDHFGTSEHQRPACHIDIRHVRWLEEQHRRNVEDDTEALRTIRGLVGEHETLRRSAEEQGYARGLEDAKKRPEELVLAAAPSPTPQEAHRLDSWATECSEPATGKDAEPASEHGELHPDRARATARSALGYAHAFDGRGINWQSDEPWPHRIELAQALDWITELGAMVLNLADRIAAECDAEAPASAADGAKT